MYRVMDIRLCDEKLKSSFTNDRRKRVKVRVEKWLENINNVECKYYEIYKRNFLIPRLVKEYFTSDITEKRVREQIVITRGRNYNDGFSGILLKNMCYTNDFLVEIKDGERGQLFFKKYNYFPKVEDIIIDSILQN